VKLCKKCNVIKSLTSFNKRSDSNGLRAHCKECSSKENVLRNRIRTGAKLRTKMSIEEQKERNKLAYKKLNAKPERKAKQAFYEAKRRATKHKATPKWLTAYQLEAIELYYIAAKQFSILFGQKLEVDHIIPLRGVNVSGLHVPWNLQLMVDSENRRKNNKVNYEF